LELKYQKLIDTVIEMEVDKVHYEESFQDYGIEEDFLILLQRRPELGR